MKTMKTFRAKSKKSKYYDQRKQKHRAVGD